MTLNSSLKSRVKRLEQAASVGTEPTLTDYLIEAERRRAMTADEQAASAEAFMDRFGVAMSDPRPGSVCAALQECTRRYLQLHPQPETGDHA